MDYLFPVVVAKRFSDTDIENTTNDQQGNFFKVHVYGQRSVESHFMVAEADLQQISQLEVAIYLNNPALRSSRMIGYYFDRNGFFVMMATQADFDRFLNTCIDQHIYMLEVPQRLLEITTNINDSEIIFKFETYELDSDSDSDLSTQTESDFDESDAAETYWEDLDREEFNLMAYGHAHARRAG